MLESRAEITRLARRWSAGDQDAFDALIERVYPELRALAHRQLRRYPGQATVSTTVLVHEAYVKLAGVSDGDWRSRAHFFAFSAKVMRNILVDLARRRQADRRGGGRVRVTLDSDAVAVESRALEVLALDQALRRVAEHDERMARIVECRCFGGMSVKETAAALSTSARTIEREWARARAYMHLALEGRAG